MTSLKVTGLRLVVLLALQLVWVSTSQAATTEEKFKEETAKQRAIYDSRGEARPEGYVIDRSLLSYGYTLPTEFSGALSDLGPEGRWLDIGAGEGKAVIDYATAKYDVTQPQAKRRGKKARAVAISLEDRRTPQWQQAVETFDDEKQIQYFYGKRLRDYSTEEIGKFNVISDVMGAFSYVQDLTLFMEKTLGFLETNGAFYTVLQDVKAEDGSNKPFYPNASYLTEIVKADGSDMKMCTWLKNISCVEVTCELKMNWSPPIEVYRIKKTCDAVSVPKLVPTHFESGTPPERKFLLGAPAQTTATR